MSFYFEQSPELSRKLNELARHRMLTKLYQDIRIDITVCRLEGWDYREYLQRIRDAVDYFLREE